MAKLLLDGTGLTVEALASAARGSGGVTLAESGLARMRETRALIDHAIDNRIPVYGVTTGLGARSSEALDAETLAGFSLQTIRGRAHAAGDPMPRETVRALMLSRLNTLLTGYSGARPHVAEYLAAVLDANLVPLAGGLGSIGGGDLVINATVALALIGEGRMTGPDGQEGPAADMLRAAGIEPLKLAPRDGLALANHTGFSAGLGALALDGALTGFAAAQAAACLTMEGFRANLTPLDPRALAAKPLPGQSLAADALRALLEGSPLWQPGAARRLQDPLSLRNTVQIHGGTAAALANARPVVECELNGASDNPIAIAETGEVISCGAYHSTELGLALESVSRAWQHLAMGLIARIARMMDPDFTALPLFLARPDSGSNGFAPLLKLAEDLAAEITRAAMPQPVWPSINANGVEDSLTSAPTAARALARINDLGRRLTAIELMVGAQAADLHDITADLGPPMARLYRAIRAVSPQIDTDRPLTNDVESLAKRIEDGTLTPPA